MSKYRAIQTVSDTQAYVYEKENGRIIRIERLTESLNGVMHYRFGEVSIMVKAPEELNWSEVK